MHMHAHTHTHTHMHKYTHARMHIHTHTCLMYCLSFHHIPTHPSNVAYIMILLQMPLIALFLLWRKEEGENDPDYPDPVVKCLMLFTVFFQSYLFAVSGENLTVRLRDLSFRAMLRQVGIGHTCSCGQIWGQNKNVFTWRGSNWGLPARTDYLPSFLQ